MGTWPVRLGDRGAGRGLASSPTEPLKVIPTPDRQPGHDVRAVSLLPGVDRGHLLPRRLVAHRLCCLWRAVGGARGHDAAHRRHSLLERIVGLARPLSPAAAALALKDIRLFWRDPTQWIQFMIFFGLLWQGAMSLAAAHDIYRPILWGVVGALVLYTVHGLFDSPYWKNDLSVEFWLLAALQVVAVRAVRADRGGSHRPAGP